MTTINGAYGVTDTGIKQGVEWYEETVCLPGISSLRLFFSWKYLGLHNWRFPKKQINGLHINGWFRRYECYGLLILHRFN